MLNNHNSLFSAFVFLALLLLTSSIKSQVIAPEIKIKTSGAITDFFIDGSEVILSTDAGTIEAYNFENGRQTGVISLPELMDFMGDPLPAKVYSIDKLNDRLLIVTQGIHGFRNVLIIDDENQIKLIDSETDEMMIKKARFVNERQILLGLMSNELILYDFEINKPLYILSISAYTFSDFDMSDDKEYVFTSDESGVVHKIDVQQGKVVKEYTGINVDNIYKLVCHEGTIVTAGQDRRVGVYKTMTGDQYYLQRDFLVYCVGLNNEGTIGAYCADEENNIVIFDITSKKEIGELSGHQSVVTKMEFIEDHTLITASDDQYLMIWNLGN